MQLLENISLKPFNSFGIDVMARRMAVFSSVAELGQILTSTSGIRCPKLVLGGGSNILLKKDYDGLILKNEIMGMDKVKEDEEFVYIRAGAGENWHQFVLHCIANNWAGIENLSLIPGCCGASPMQNIGAYGVEIKDVFHELKAFHLKEKCNYTFGVKECEFDYRESVFKKKYKNEFAIASVTYKLRKKPMFNISYGAIREELDNMGIKDLTIKAVSDAVIKIRSSKLPDPKLVGNAGSFFKNPVVSAEVFEKLKSRFDNIVGYSYADGSTKLAAGWLIEHAGPDENTSWKGFRRGDAGVNPDQALVLVNYGGASGQEIYDLSEEILISVREKFGVELEREVNVIT